MYGGFDTIKSNFLPNTSSIVLLKNLTLFDSLYLNALFLATEIAFLEISTPIPIDFVRLLSKLIIMQPDPVPISKIDIFFPLYIFSNLSTTTQFLVLELMYLYSH